jgi:hypothetical protein
MDKRAGRNVSAMNNEKMTITAPLTATVLKISTSIANMPVNPKITHKAENKIALPVLNYIYDPLFLHCQHGVGPPPFFVGIPTRNGGLL